MFIFLDQGRLHGNGRQILWIDPLLGICLIFLKKF